MCKMNEHYKKGIEFFKISFYPTNVAYLLFFSKFNLADEAIVGTCLEFHRLFCKRLWSTFCGIHSTNFSSSKNIYKITIAVFVECMFFFSYFDFSFARNSLMCIPFSNWKINRHDGKLILQQQRNGWKYFYGIVENSRWRGHKRWIYGRKLCKMHL